MIFAEKESRPLSRSEPSLLSSNLPILRVSGKGSVRPVSIPPRKLTSTKAKMKPYAGEVNALFVEKKGGVTPVELQVPDFSKGIVKKDASICSKCLESINEAYIKFKREQLEEAHEEGRIHGHEHVHEH